MGGAGADVILGGDDGDSLVGDDGDSLVGGAGSDTLLGLNGADTIHAADDEADTVAKSGNRTGVSLDDMVTIDNGVDTIDEAFSVLDSWIDGWP